MLIWGKNPDKDYVPFCDIKPYLILNLTKRQNIKGLNKFFFSMYHINSQQKNIVPHFDIHYLQNKTKYTTDPGYTF